MMKVLLVNIPSSSKSFKNSIHFSLGLLKLYEFYRRRNDQVYLVDSPRLVDCDADIICFSPVFLFDIKKAINTISAYSKRYPGALIRIGGLAVTLRPDIFKHHFPRAHIHVGELAEIDLLPPAFDMIDQDICYGFTTRGCINACKWCVVPRVEGKLRIMESFTNLLSHNKKIFRCMDNNILAAGPEHVERVLREIKDRGMLVDFNQGLDCILFARNERFVELFKEYGCLEKIVFSWDSTRQDKDIVKTLDLLDKHDLKKEVRIFMLYGFMEQPEVFFKRFKYLYDRRVRIKIMRYRDITTGEYGNYWNGFDEIMRRFIQMKFVTGIITPDNASDVIGKVSTFEEFKQLAVSAVNMINNRKEPVKISNIPLIDSVKNRRAKISQLI